MPSKLDPVACAMRSVPISRPRDTEPRLLSLISANRSCRCLLASSRSCSRNCLITSPITCSRVAPSGPSMLYVFPSGPATEYVGIIVSYGCRVMGPNPLAPVEPAAYPRSVFIRSTRSKRPAILSISNTSICFCFNKSSYSSLRD